MQFVLPVSQYLSRALDTARSTLTLLLSSRPLRRTHYTLLSFCLLFDHWSVSHALSLMQKLSARQVVGTKAAPPRSRARRACLTLYHSPPKYVHGARIFSSLFFEFNTEATEKSHRDHGGVAGEGK